MRKGKPSYNILITAGPTREPMDPVRYISNHSTGIMGYAIARETAKRGFRTCLISGPVSLSSPPGVEFVEVTTAREMRDRVMERIDKADCLIMAAAVCDFRPLRQERRKIKKKSGKAKIELVQNPDILKDIGRRKGLVKVGFALETGNLAENAWKKLEEKRMDLIVANIKSANKEPFGEGAKDFLIIDKQRDVAELKGATKAKCAGVIVKKVERLLE